MEASAELLDGTDDSRLGNAAGDLFNATPTNEAELADKVLIAAFVGAMAIGANAQKAGGQSSVDPATLEAWARTLLEASADDCLRTVTQARPYIEIQEHAALTLAKRPLTPGELVPFMLGVSGTAWRLMIAQNAKKLGILL